jgi:subtilisin family serine protease
MRHKKITRLAICFAAAVLLMIPVIMGIYRMEKKREEYANAKGRVIVVFDGKVTKDELSSMISSIDAKINVVRHIDDYALLFVKESSKFDSVMEKLRESPKVRVVQADGKIQTMGLTNDTDAGTQRAINLYGRKFNILRNANIQKQSVSNVDMNVVEAWKQYAQMAHTDRQVIVAVVDTGVDYTHPDLAQNMWVNTKEVPGDGIDNDGNGYVDDIYGWDFYNGDATVCHYKQSGTSGVKIASPDDNDNHGTHVAGIIGAVANNNIGISGIASNINIKIMSLKINGGKEGNGSISDAIEAIKYATMMGANICNLSWGTSQYVGALGEIMKESDMLFVAAAGNSGANNDDSPIYPANLSLDNLISVTFVDPNGALTKLSDYGLKTVDLAAPGQDIFSTVVGSYGFMSGSSMAAPQVSGLAAMIYGCSEHVYASDIKKLITGNIKFFANLQGYMKNAGIPDAYNTVLHSDSLSKDADPPTVSCSTLYHNEVIRVPVKVSDAGGSGLRIVKWLPGKQTLENFRRGMEGNTLENNQLSVLKTGDYSIYASDYAGNETISTYRVKGDTVAPKIALSCKTSGKIKTITVKVSDSQSGVKRVEYMLGSRKADEFLPAESGLKLNLKNATATFRVKEDGTYSVYACDNRGNQSVRVIVVGTVKTKSIQFASGKLVMEKKTKYRLRVKRHPVNSVDKVTYASADRRIAVVSATGVVTTRRKGKVRITAKIPGAKAAVCIVTVTD